MSENETKKICILDRQECVKGKYVYCHNYTHCIFMMLVEVKNEWTNNTAGEK